MNIEKEVLFKYEYGIHFPSGGGITNVNGGSGASHGGRGGRGGIRSPFTLCSNLPYGSIYDEGTWGSGGGAGSSPGTGGRGGGIIYLNINRKLTLDGQMVLSGEAGKVS